MGVATGDWAALVCSAPAPAAAPLPPLTQRLGWRELRRLEAELRRDLRPGVVEADFPPELAEAAELWALFGLKGGREPQAALVPGVAEYPDAASSLDEAPVDFLLDLRLETLFLLSMSDSLMLLPAAS